MPRVEKLVVCPLNKLTLDLRGVSTVRAGISRSTTRSATCEQPQDHFWDIPLVEIIRRWRPRGILADRVKVRSACRLAAGLRDRDPGGAMVGMHRGSGVDAATRPRRRPVRRPRERCTDRHQYGEFLPSISDDHGQSAGSRRAKNNESSRDDVDRRAGARMRRYRPAVAAGGTL